MILDCRHRRSPRWHVAFKPYGIVSGVIVLYGMVRATRLDGWTALFLATTVLTSVHCVFLSPHRASGRPTSFGVLIAGGAGGGDRRALLFPASPDRAVDLRVGAVLVTISTSSSPSCRRSRAAAAGGAAPTQSETSVPDCAACRDGDLIVLGVVACGSGFTPSFEYQRFTVFSLLGAHRADMPAICSNS